MRLMAKETRKDSPDTEKAKRLALAVVGAEKELNVLRSSFKEDADKLKQEFDALSKEIEGKKGILKAEVANLEARRAMAVRPIMDEIARANRQSEEAAKSMANLIQREKALETKATMDAKRSDELDAREKRVGELEAVLTESFLLAKRKKEEMDKAQADAQMTVLRLMEEILAREAAVETEENKLKVERSVLAAEFTRLATEKETTAKEIDRLASERRKLKQNMDYLEKTYGKRAVR